MPAVSQKQQRFMGMVRAAQKGELKDPSPEVARAAKSMSSRDVKDFASTKHDDLPETSEKAASAGYLAGYQKTAAPNMGKLSAIIRAFRDEFRKKVTAEEAAAIAEKARRTNIPPVVTGTNTPRPRPAFPTTKTLNDMAQPGYRPADPNQPDLYNKTRKVLGRLKEIGKATTGESVIGRIQGPQGEQPSRVQKMMEVLGRGTGAAAGGAAEASMLDWSDESDDPTKKARNMARTLLSAYGGSHLLSPAAYAKQRAGWAGKVHPVLAPVSNVVFSSIPFGANRAFDIGEKLINTGMATAAKLQTAADSTNAASNTVSRAVSAPEIKEILKTTKESLPATLQSIRESTDNISKTTGNIAEWGKLLTPSGVSDIFKEPEAKRRLLVAAVISTGLLGVGGYGVAALRQRMISREIEKRRQIEEESLRRQKRMMSAMVNKLNSPQGA